MKNMVVTTHNMSVSSLYAEPAFNPRDFAVLVGVFALHIGSLLWLMQEPEPIPPVKMNVLQVSMIQLPPEEKPPEPEKPEPPKPKDPPPKPAPPIVTKTPVAEPIPEPPPPAPVAVAAPSGGVKELGVIRKVEPAYPEAALDRGIEGVVELLIHVNELGIPGIIEISKSSGRYDMDNAARRAVKKWIFAPQIENGVAVPSVGTLKITFKLKT
ncbi:MAG: energy transducer TonB [Gammaproteobacteria bacterium]|nr:energy transducer TonB [Gammaproteobacteria bacterium]